MSTIHNAKPRFNCAFNRCASDVLAFVMRRARRHTVHHSTEVVFNDGTAQSLAYLAQVDDTSNLSSAARTFSSYKQDVGAAERFYQLRVVQLAPKFCDGEPCLSC